ncbi:hypothetical protein CTU88_38695 [Streptomyces sp. JV178]|uniref:hypothetical protein n=1 Tax=Streptomyces sp. JV178 TaxID=858632 RepID=UPI000C1B1705|nr:hypothetical protein [Streptomyces sp. JV178]PIM66957.1 hypothetical protein CTU88_38695 [Streptomyces sp. JV178]
MLDPALRPGWASEPKWDGYRAQLAVYAGGRVLLRSRRDRLAFEGLQQRLARRGAAATQAAREWPAPVVAFDLAGEVTT